MCFEIFLEAIDHYNDEQGVHDQDQHHFTTYAHPLCQCPACPSFGLIVHFNGLCRYVKFQSCGVTSRYGTRTQTYTHVFGKL
ncbi:unnamed protein product [Amoebophrya sp. A25]|nr:unnamed protein product [Amoebophrya sp. A25]|eukprot:GSA25T00004278001.1